MLRPKLFARETFRILKKRARRVRRALRYRLLPPFAFVKRRLNSQVTYVAVTGSCGKTTTASMIGAVLSTTGQCIVQIERNYILALAQSILSVSSSTCYSVHEISGSRPGRVRSQTRILRPSIGVITTVGSDHYKTYRSLEATAKEKGQLAEVLPRAGTLILNADDMHVRAMASRTHAVVITCGLSEDADVRATEVSSVWPERLALTVVYANQSIRIQTNLVGEVWTTSILAAVASGIACGLDLTACANAIEKYEPRFGRWSVHKTPEGAVYVFDHKAPLWTINSCLTFLAQARAPYKTVIFGTIADYGGSAGSKYRRIAREALGVAERVIFVGPQSGHVTRMREYQLHERLFAFPTVYQAAEFMQEQGRRDELILIKGSIAADHLERIFLSQGHRIVCWKQGCGITRGCPYCKKYNKPFPPPFGLGKKSEFVPPVEPEDVKAITS